MSETHPSGGQADDLTQDSGDAAPGDESVNANEPGGGLRGYVIGLALAALLTAASFYTLTTDLIWAPAIPMALIVLAIAQMGVHLVFFLHITTGPDNTNNVLALGFRRDDRRAGDVRIAVDHEPPDPRGHAGGRDDAAYAVGARVAAPIRPGRFSLQHRTEKSIHFSDRIRCFRYDLSIDLRGKARTLFLNDALEPFPFARNQLSLRCRIFDGEPDPLHLKMQLPQAAYSTVNRIHFT